MKDFLIEIASLSWIDGKEDNPEDLCLHGKIRMRIKDIELFYEATVSATALYLLKSLTEDLPMGKRIQILPCCGNTFVANENLTRVEILGCDNGIDFSIIHQEDKLKFVFEDGRERTIDFDDYRKEVVDFAKKIKDFYDKSSEKVFENSYDKEGYEAYWNEFNERLEKSSSL